jgi:hypothetical protein
LDEVKPSRTFTKSNFDSSKILEFKNFKNEKLNNKGPSKKNEYLFNSGGRHTNLRINMKKDE